MSEGKLYHVDDFGLNYDDFKVEVSVERKSEFESIVNAKVDGHNVNWITVTFLPPLAGDLTKEAIFRYVNSKAFMRKLKLQKINNAI